MLMGESVSGSIAKENKACTAVYSGSGNQGYLEFSVIP